MHKLVLFLPALAFCAAAQANDPVSSRLTDEDKLSSDQPILSVAETRKAVEDGALYCQTDNMVGSHIDTMTVCDLATTPAPVGTHYRFVLGDDGLYPLFCSGAHGCSVPPSVQARLTSLQRLKINEF